jgi:hypothetical protein
MGWTAQESYFDSRQGQDILVHVGETGSENHPADYAINTGVFPQGVKRPEREAD